MLNNINTNNMLDALESLFTGPFHGQPLAFASVQLTYPRAAQRLTLFYAAPQLFS